MKIRYKILGSWYDQSKLFLFEEDMTVYLESPRE